MHIEMEETTGDIAKDVLGYSNKISSELIFKLNMSRMDMRGRFDKHLDSLNSKSLKISFFQDTDILFVGIESVCYFIYCIGKTADEWIVWNDTNSLEVVLFPDWTYEDLVGGMALLTQGSKARLWNRIGKQPGVNKELCGACSGIRIQALRLRDPNRMFM